MATETWAMPCNGKNMNIQRLCITFIVPTCSNVNPFTDALSAGFTWSTKTSRNVTIRLALDGPSAQCTPLKAHSREFIVITSIRSIHRPTSRETLGSHSQRLKPASKRSARGQEAQHSLTCFFADNFLSCVLFLLYVYWALKKYLDVSELNKYQDTALQTWNGPS